MKKSINYLTSVAILAFATVGHAQSDHASSVGNLGWLSDLAGHWQGFVSITLGSHQTKAMYYVDFATASDGQGILMKEECEIPDIGKLHGTNLIGYDSNDGKIHWFTVDNMGTTHEHIGTLSDSQHFAMIHQSTLNGKKYVEDISMELISEDSLELNVIASLDGDVQEVIQGVFVRRQETTSLNH